MARANSTSAWDYQSLLILSAGISLGAFLHYFSHGEILLYGDAVAHINIARRVFDSRTPGPLQLGTVWLPLPHICTIPFIISTWAWQTGAGGSVVSLVSYVLGAIGIARFFWGISLSNFTGGHARRLSGWAAALTFLLNPNLLYMQATAMTESLSLALTIWAIVFYAEFAAADGDGSGVTEKSLLRCGMVLALGMLTRYDQWFLTLAIWACCAFVLFRPGASGRSCRREQWCAFFEAMLLTALIAVLWLAYNFGQYGNAFEFALGPYSARAIAQRSATAGQQPYPGYHNLWVAMTYFFKSAQLNLANSKFGWIWIAIAIVAALALVLRHRFDVLLVFWLPLIFYSFSIAYGGVPIFMPIWWPFSYYNVRYGLELLPAFALSAGIVVLLLSQLRHTALRRSLQAGILLALLAGYVAVERSVPICLREARVNSMTRIAFENQLASLLRRLPNDPTLLMYTGNHVGALEQGAIPLRRTINENNYRIWQGALAHPAESADYVIAMEADPVWRASQEHPEGLRALAIIHVQGQPAATVYQSSLSKSPK